MRTLFAFILIALLAGVGIVAVIETDPGYVLLSYGRWTLETSLWVGLVLLVLLVLVIYWVFRLMYRLISGQRMFRNWLGSRKSEQALRQSTRGVISYTEGNWDRARRQLERGLAHNEAPLVNYLLAARAAGHAQQSGEALDYLRQAADTEPGAKVAVEITLAEIRLQESEYGQALAALKTARTQVGKHPQVLDLLRKCYLGLGDWDAMLELLPELKKHKRLTPEEFSALERETHSRQLWLAARGPGASGESIEGAWQHVPARLKQDGKLLGAYVDGLMVTGDHGAAEKVLQKALKHEWSPQLVRRFGFLDGDNTSRRLTQAERWLEAHDDDAELLLCLGRLSARDKLWGKARDYFERAYRLEPGGEVCAELGRLLIALGEPKVAAAYYREGLTRSESGLPDLPMPEKLISDGQLLARS